RACTPAGETVEASPYTSASLPPTAIPHARRAAAGGPSNPDRFSRSGRRRRRDRPDLLHQPEGVPVRVIFDNLPVGDAVDADAGDGCLLPGGCDAEQVALVRPAASPASNDGVALGDLRVDHEGEVGERRSVARSRLLDALDPSVRLRQR